MVEIFLLEQLTVFAKYGTLSKAAEILHITQPALSRSMKKLEEIFEVPLFVRSKSRIMLNETGKYAAIRAQEVLEADAKMLESTRAFDRSRNTVSIGSCASLPIDMLMPIFQETFKGKTIATEIMDDESLIKGLKNQTHQIAILHKVPEDRDIFTKKYIDEHLYVSFPKGDPLASRGYITFKDIDGMSVLGHRNARFWVEICQQNMQSGRLMAQDSLEILRELVDASSLPVFSSDLTIMRSNRPPMERIAVPLSDESAYATYYLACAMRERDKYGDLFEAVELKGRELEKQVSGSASE